MQKSESAAITEQGAQQQRPQPGAAESPPPDNALTESPDDSPSSAGAEAALGWMRDTVSAVSGQASPASPSQREAHVPSEGPNTNSWVYERAELMDRLKKESSMRAKAEVCLIFFCLSDTGHHFCDLA